MNISILTVFSELYDTFLRTSLMHRAQEKGLVQINVDSFFSYVSPKERIDAPVFGHGSGMLLRPEVVEKAIEDKEQLYGKAYKIFFSPQGKKLDQRELKNLLQHALEREHLMLIPARYEGMDARVETYYADTVISLGDFVLMAGDLPAMVLLEGMVRLLPGVVGKQESIEQESFSGALVDYPSYTEPVVWKGMEVPAVVRSGNHEALRTWRLEQAAHKSVLGHFDWLRSSTLTEEEKKVVARYIPHHYVALMHSDVFIGEEKMVGTTSVTSIDIHDIARASKMYGVNRFFIVTPLYDQQKIVQTLLDFWSTGHGVNYNKHRHDAVKQVEVVEALDDVIAAIEAQEGVRPLIVATSARVCAHERQITFYDQEKLWALQRPILLLFGTGKGLTDAVLQRVDFLLLPVKGLTEFNHLSVRSAVAVVLDRWLGLNEKNI